MTKKKTKIIVCLVLSIFLVLLLVVIWLIVGIPSGIFSEEKHIQRIRERAEERFLGEDSEYTGLEVYPIYNEYDELKYALIEFEPQGFIYVYINGKEYPWMSMYSLSDMEFDGWMPYRVKEGVNEKIVDENGNVIAQSFNQEYIRDENGQVIVYNESHFKVAGIENERRYFLSTVCTVNMGITNGLIPAVKRGEQYLNLVDGAMIDYTPGMESAYAVAEIAFINNVGFDL